MVKICLSDHIFLGAVWYRRYPCPKGSQITPKWSQTTPKCSEMTPILSQMTPKLSQMAINMPKIKTQKKLN